MFKTHKEGNATIRGALWIIIAINALIQFLYPPLALFLFLTSMVVLAFLLYFFRDPARIVSEPSDSVILSPADGKIVNIEKVMENEFCHGKRWMVSIFMSPADVHVNRIPINGEVTYYKYHPGKYMVAWHPKSSEENERTSTAIRNDKTEVFLRQIAGAVARRIVNYMRVGQQVTQGDELGFIKFGSRVDLFLSEDIRIEVQLNQRVVGNQTIIGRVPEVS